MNLDLEKKVYEVSIAGLPLKLRSSHSPETVEQLIRLVNDKIQESLSQGVSFQNALILSSLHMAEDIMLLKNSALQELGDLEGQARRILTELETSPVTKIRLDN